MANSRSSEAFLVQVDPTAKAHADVRFQLLNRRDIPVFFSRPVFELFDAVGPPDTEIKVKVAAYSLKLSTPCYWRLVGAADRKNADFDSNNTNQKMKWELKEAKKEIKWLPLRVAVKVDGVESSKRPYSFDIAIVVNQKKVVVFRNQEIAVDQEKKNLVEDAQKYLKNTFQRDDIDLDEAAKFDEKGESVSLVLNYNYLAGKAEQSRPQLLEIMDLEQFLKTMRNEDEQLKLPK